MQHSEDNWGEQWYYWQLEKEKCFPLGEDWQALAKENEKRQLDERKMFLPAFVEDEENAN